MMNEIEKKSIAHSIKLLKGVEIHKTWQIVVDRIEAHNTHQPKEKKLDIQIIHAIANDCLNKVSKLTENIQESISWQQVLLSEK